MKKKQSVKERIPKSVSVLDAVFQYMKQRKGVRYRDRHCEAKRRLLAEELAEVIEKD